MLPLAPVTPPMVETAITPDCRASLNRTMKHIAEQFTIPGFAGLAVLTKPLTKKQIREQAEHDRLTLLSRQLAELPQQKPTPMPHHHLADVAEVFEPLWLSVGRC